MNALRRVLSVTIATPSFSLLCRALIQTLGQNHPRPLSGLRGHLDLIHKALHHRKAQTGALFRVAGGEKRLHGLFDVRDADALSVTVIFTSRSG